MRRDAVLAKSKWKNGPAASSYKAEDYPYQREDYLLSCAERTFYNSLYTAVGSDLQVFPKVRLIDLVKVRLGTANTQGYKNRIDRKHVDFVVRA
jgi:hypothetical protein